MEKSRRTFVLKWVTLICLLAYAVIAASWAIGKAKARPIQGIEVSIDKSSPIAAAMSPESVKAELGQLALNYSKIPAGKLNTDSLERFLATVNNFEHVECYINTLGQLCLQVKPMVPVARIFTPEDSYYINHEGKRINARPEYYVNVPIVSGNFTPQHPATNVLPVVNHIASDSVLRSLVTMIEYKSPRNIMLIPRIRGHVINLGDTNRLDEKFANLRLFYRKVMPVKGWNYYDTIYLKFNGQVVASRRDKRLPDRTVEYVESEFDETTDIPIENLAPASVDNKPQNPG